MFLDLGCAPTVVVSSADMAEEIIKTNDIIFSNRLETTAANFLYYGSTYVAFSQYGEYWRQAKKICVLKLLSLKRVQSFQYDMFVGGTDSISIALEWVMAELIRSPSIMKRAQEDIRRVVACVKFRGYDIPPKTRVLINVFTIQRDPKIWDRPEEFVPDRFQDNQVDFKGLDFELIPFGGGRRGCPGMSFGVAIAKYVIANL
nr:cytochrome p450 71a1 [Quercus suber]